MSKSIGPYLICILLVASTNQALAVPFTVYGVVTWNEYIEHPSIVIPQSSLGPEKDIPNPIGTSIVCIDAYTQKLLNCPYTFWLKGVDLGNDPQVERQIVPALTHIQIYGGHEHDFATHPFYWALPPPYDPIQVTGGTFTRPSFLSVTGQTQYTWASITYDAPQTAGSVWQEVDIGSPPDYICVGECYTFTDSLEHDTILVGFSGLQQLNPAGATDYIVRRGSDTSHPDSEATWGTPYTIEQLLNIAYQYHQWSGYLLSINDMSLPEGGMFDLDADKTYTNWLGDVVSGTWNIPHRDQDRKSTRLNSSHH